MLSTISVKLQTCLDKPYWVCDRAGNYACVRSSAKMHPCSLLAVIELLTYNSLAVGISVEVDTFCRDCTG